MACHSFLSTLPYLLDFRAKGVSARQRGGGAVFDPSSSVKKTIQYVAKRSRGWRGCVGKGSSVGERGVDDNMHKNCF